MAKQEITKEHVFDIIVESIKEILNSTRGVQGMASEKPITVKTNILEEVGLDSVEVLDLLSLVETRLEITITPEKLGPKVTVGAIIDHVMNLLDNR